MLNYIGLIPLLVKGHNEQQLLIDTLIARLINLETIVSNCCGMVQRSAGEQNTEINSRTIELKNIRSVVLDQNVPNPFHDQTDINYTIPADVKNATLLFYDHSGQVLQTIIIKERGNGSIHVYAPDLSSGIYTYTLIADDKVVDTKRMMKAK
jgi:hypothetical protein